METRSLSPSGLEVSLVGLGCNNFGGRIDKAATARVVDKAIDLGITHFDTADIYGSTRSEEYLGELLGDRRKTIVLATKFGKMADAVPGVRGTRDYILKAAEASLKRLRTDWIDLYYMHEPDPKTPIEESLRAFEELVAAGKVRHVAASNFSASEISYAVAAADRFAVPGFIACQDEYNLLSRDLERSLMPAINSNDLALIPFYPLAGGALSGKYRKGAPLPEGARLSRDGGSNPMLSSNWDAIEKLRGLAERRGHSLLELAMSWLAGRPRVASVIAGATRPEQVEANVKAVDWEISEADLAEIDALTAPG